MTAQFDQLKASCYLARQVSNAEVDGISLELLDDFDLFRKVADSTEGRAPLTPIFDNRVSDVSSENAFWILGRNPEGDVVHLQALRRDDLKGVTLDQHMRHQGPLLMSPHIPGIPGDSIYDACAYTREMSGRVCYHGEVWLSPKGPYRGRGLAVTLPRVGVTLALMRWAPDFIYGLVHPDLAFKGIPARYGYVHMHPRGIRWRRSDGDGTLDECITWMTGDDMRDLVEAS